MKEFFSNLLPLFWNLIFGILFIAFFINALSIINKIKTVEKNKRITNVYFKNKLTVRGFLTLLAGITFIILFFFKIKMSVLSFCFFGIAYMDCVRIAVAAEKSIKEILDK